MRAIFRQRFVRTKASRGLDARSAGRLIRKLRQGDDDSEEEAEEDTDDEEINAVMRSLVQQCLPQPEVGRVAVKVMQDLWSGLGTVYEVSTFVKKSVGDRAGEDRHGGSIVVKHIRPLDEVLERDDFELQRDRASYAVEVSFYERGHAAALCDAGAACPRLLLVDRSAEGRLSICMTRADGERPGHYCSATETRAALAWLARLHALYWGHGRADAAAMSGLHQNGCYWDLDLRGLELEATPHEGLAGRLRSAARGLHRRLRGDEMQTICHGDPKAANMVFATDGTLTFLDFQWAGKAPPTKDVAYCLVCGACSLEEEEEEAFLRYYHEELSDRLVSQGDLAPEYLQVKRSYQLAICDLARWMAGFGWWGNAGALKRQVSAVLEEIDGGLLLESEDVYQERILSLFPCCS